MSYTVIKNGSAKYDILEKETRQVIEIGKSETDTKNICRKLNLGAGFIKWTPSFFAKKFDNLV